MKEPMPKLTHEICREQLLALAYGELDRREARAVREHVAACPECREELARLGATRAAFSALEDEPAPPAGEAALLAAAREAARQRQRPAPILPSWLWGGAMATVGAAAVAVLALRLVVPSHDGPGRPPPDALMGRAPEPVSPPASSVATAAPPEDDARAGLLGWKGAPGASPGAAPSALAEGGPVREEKRRAAAARLAPSSRAPAQDRVAGQEALDKGAPSLAREEAGGSAQLRAAPEPPGPARTKSFAAAPPSKIARADELEGHRPSAPPAGIATAEEEADAVGTVAVEPEANAAAPAAVAPRAEAKREAAGAGARDKAAAGAVDAVARYNGLALAGRLRATTAGFAGCPGEASRRVERDEQGRVVKYTRRGARGGTPFEAELFYGVDGLLGAVRYREGDGAVRELRLGGPAAPGAAVAARIPAWALEPGRAEEAAPGAPPRCGG